MKTKLISITKPFIDTGEKLLTPEDFIVYIARVSNPSNQLNTDTGSKLIKYLLDHKHFSPFEHVTATVSIETSRAIAAQILRHRSFSFQEFSQRYAKAVDWEPLQWRLQGKTNRQVGDEDIKLSKELEYKVQEVMHKSFKLYDELLESGVAKECARMVLPLNTQTRIYMTGNVRSWIHYLQLRLEKDTQKEHRDIAVSIANDLLPYLPNILPVALGSLLTAPPAIP